MKKKDIMKIGIDLGGSHIAIGVVDKNGKILEKVEKKLKGLLTKEVKQIIEKTIIEAVNKYKEQYEISEIGKAIPKTVTKDEKIKTVK